MKLQNTAGASYPLLYQVLDAYGTGEPHKSRNNGTDPMVSGHI
ncbi:MAG: hypothetical protein PVF39_16230 [Desulfobacterales bacterium]